MSPPDRLQPYRHKRRASATPEPMGSAGHPKTGKLFVVQQHWASHLHFDLRLEHRGVLLSWAVPKGPSYDPQDKRFAAHVEDHPVDYADFEGEIPAGNYGAGHVIVWDRGTWTPQNDVEDGLKKGKLLFDLAGHKLRGRWTLVRMKGRDNKPNEWLLIKEHDAYVSDDQAPLDNTSILSGLTVEERSDPAGWVRAVRKAATRVTRKKWRSQRFVKPMLAQSSDAFDRSGWLFEFKYDGYRLQAVKNGNTVQLFSRNGNDLTEHLPELTQTLTHIPIDHFVVDGEVVVHDAGNRPSFGLLQERFSAASEAELAALAVRRPVTFWVFDLLAIDGLDCRDAPLQARKRLLKRLVPSFGNVRYSEHISANGKALFRQAQAIGIEGIVGKSAKAPYKSGRSPSWIKVRHRKTDDFAVVGYRTSKSNPADLGSLALAAFSGSEYVYVGNVASGLTQSERESLQAELDAAPKGEALIEGERYRWVTPEFACEVAFAEYTQAGHLRQPTFERRRADKAPEDCHGRLIPETQSLAPAPPPEVAITNADKIFFPELGLEKRDLVTYYERIAPWMLPYLADRPIVLTRFPDGVHGKSFYQRDAPDFVPDWLQRATLYSESADREVNYFIVDSAAALKYLANMAAIPIHTWHARLGQLDKPDWCVLDLDPKGAPFSDVVRLARAIHELAQELELPAFPKTSGASGLHVLIPLNQSLSHEQSRLFGELLARVIVARHPDIATIARAVGAREGKVYVDYLQNGHGRLLVAPFSARAEPSAGVSMPLRWHEVTNKLDNPRHNIKNAISRMKRLKEDPMSGLLAQEADLLRALERLNLIFNRLS